jgi:hypothetical protein
MLESLDKLNVKIVCLCSFLTYQACKAHAQYYSVICGLSCSTIFFHITSKAAGFSEEEVMEYKMCFFSTNFV